MKTTTLTTGRFTQEKIDALNALAADNWFTQIMRTVLPAETFEAVIKAEFLAYLCTTYDHYASSDGWLTMTFEQWRSAVIDVDPSDEPAAEPEPGIDCGGCSRCIGKPASYFCRGSFCTCAVH